MSSGMPTGPPPHASAPVRRPTATRRPAANRPRAVACSARRRWAGCATPRSCPRARSRPTPTVRSAGSSSASSNPSRSPRSPSRWPEAASCTTCWNGCCGELDGPVTPDTLAAAQAILDRLLARLAADGGAALGVGSPEVVRAGALRAIEADLRRYLEHEARTAGEWRPLGLELRFGFEGEEGSLPALELGEGPGRVRVRGVLDRVDVDGAGHAVVRDYKSGARRPAWSAARWAEDRQLQVALYMLVVRELTGVPARRGLLPAAARRRPPCPWRVRQGHAGRWRRRRHGRPGGRGARRDARGRRRARGGAGGCRCAPANSSRARRTARATAAATRPSAAASERVAAIGSTLRGRRERAVVRPRRGGARVDAGAAAGHRAPNRRSPARRRRRQRQDLGAGGALRPVGAPGRRGYLGDAHHHLHREGGRRAARPYPGAPARAGRDRGGAADRGRLHLHHPWLLRPGAARQRPGRRARSPVRGAGPLPVRAPLGGGVRGCARRAGPG